MPTTPVARNEFGYPISASTNVTIVRQLVNWLTGAFRWASAPEGDMYWRSVRNKLQAIVGELPESSYATISPGLANPIGNLDVMNEQALEQLVSNFNVSFVFDTMPEGGSYWCEVCYRLEALYNRRQYDGFGAAVSYSTFSVEIPAPPTLQVSISSTPRMGRNAQGPPEPRANYGKKPKWF